MLVWLASYPRSGNTLTRALLHQCFGLKTRSLDNTGDDRVFASSEVRELVGHYSGQEDAEELIRNAQTSRSVHILKTHLVPPTDDPTIHIVRDGRAAIVSYFHYLREVEGLDVSLEAVLEGQVYAGSWSTHFEVISGRQNRLLLKYEDLVLHPTDSTRQIAEFIGRPPSAEFTLSFEEMRKALPKFFRSGSNDSNIAELADFDQRYQELHGEVARKLGYGD